MRTWGEIFYVFLDTWGRPGPGGNSQGDPPYHAHTGGRPITDNIGTMGEIVLRDTGSGKTKGVELYITPEKSFGTMRIREGGRSPDRAVIPSQNLIAYPVGIW